MQHLIAPVTGNTRGGHKYKCRVSWVSVDNGPFPKRHQNKLFINNSNIFNANVSEEYNLFY